MPAIKMYSTGSCPYCQMAERLLAAKGIAAFDKIRVDLDPAARLAQTLAEFRAQPA